MDELIESVGEFGRFQKAALVVVGLLSALSSATIYATIFISAEPEFYCMRHERVNSTFTSSHRVSDNETCHVWSRLQTKQEEALNHSIRYECLYDKTHYGQTIISEWDLVCDKTFLASLTQTVQIFGSIFGFCGGILGDRYGRRWATLLFGVTLTIFLIGSQFLLLPQFKYPMEYKYTIYSISQFFIGLLVNTLYCTAYILLMELTTDKYRVRLANLNSYCYVGGEVIVLVVYYYSRSWHVLNWFIGILSLVLLALSYIYLPESPAFLIAVDRMEEAMQTLNKIAKSNKRGPVDKILVERVREQESLLGNDVEDEKEAEKGVEPEKRRYHKWLRMIKSMFSFGELFRPRKVFIKTCLVFYIWIALLLLYYGISLGVMEEGEDSDPYLMYLLSCLAEVIGYICCYLNDIFGRKKTICGFFAITTLMYGLLAVLNLDESILASDLEGMLNKRVLLLMILGLLGKCAISGAYQMSYIYTGELYPTQTRSTAVIFFTCFGSISSLVSPQIIMLKKLVWPPLPYVIYSVSAVFSVLCIWILPERYDSS